MVQSVSDMARILLTTTTRRDRARLRESLEDHGHDVDLVPQGQPLISQLRGQNHDVVLIEASSTLVDTVDVVGFIHESSPQAEVIVLAEPEELPLAAASIRRGASLYLIEPVDPEDVVTLIDGALKRQRNALVVRQTESDNVDGFFGGSPSMNKLLKVVRKVAPTDATVLITGESGTGKEVFANIIHRFSRRADQGKLVTVNCGAIPEALLESELFGHVKGSFTGAVSDKHGLIHEADRGTVFLDEIGDLPLLMQVKILRFLQERMIRKVGGNRTEKVDVRVLAATNRNLVREIARERFREDLFYRLNVVQLHLPPLRRRKETIPVLVSTFLSRFSQVHNKMIRSIGPEAQAKLMAHDYPGNVRELENIMEHAVIMDEDGIIDEADLPSDFLRKHSGLALPPGVGEDRDKDMDSFGVPSDMDADQGHPVQQHLQGEPMTLAEIEAAHIRQTLLRCDGNQTQAARQLGISRTSLWRKIRAMEKDDS